VTARDPVRVISRRDAVRAGTIALAGAYLAAGTLLGACDDDRVATGASAGARLSADDARLLEDVADTLLPDTASSPGAKAAGVGTILLLLVNECSDEETQRRLRDGVAQFRAMCRDRCGGDFTALPASARQAMLVEVDAESQRLGDTHWFHLARDLMLQAYFSSEVGMTKALRYVRVPGRWTGCVPLQPGQPAWG